MIVAGSCLLYGLTRPVSLLGAAPVMLVLGRDAPVAQVSVALDGLRELDGWTRDQVAEARIAAMEPYAHLIRGRYLPSRGTFARLLDGARWWGTMGRRRYGPGPRGADGESDASRHVLNPLLLIAPIFHPPDPAELRGLSPADGRRLAALQPAAADVVLSLAERGGRVSYDVSAYLQAYAAAGAVAPRRFQLVAANARDLGFGWIAVQAAGVDAVADLDPKASEPVRISQFLGASQQCGGLCNGVVPAHPLGPWTPQIVGLPASVTLALWHTSPRPPTGAPDLTWQVEFR